jgi:membrane-bound lytic murein transglycosylase D
MAFIATTPKFNSRSTRALACAIEILLALGCHSGAKPDVGATSPPVVVAVDSRGLRGRQPALAVRGGHDAPVTPKVAEVTRTAVGVFGDSTTATTDVPDSATTGPKWDMDVRSYESQERVAFYVNFFTRNSRSRFQERLRLGTRYEPMIRAKFRAGGIPEDMSYLALVESGFDPNAYSSAAAVGMWQFMSSTARDVGLRVDWWVDERRDPARSTDAAVRFIHDLQTQFGSLYLAAAAYNGGPGRVSRGLTRFAEDMAGAQGEDRFFALAEHDYLRSETKNYVPQIIAAALVGKEPARYGLAFDSLAQYAYDSVEVAPGTALATVAKASDTPLATIKELNPAVLRGITPPNSSMWVRVPTNCIVQADQIAANLAELSPEDRLGYRTVKSKGTETTAALANTGGVTARQLASYNPGLKTSKKGKILAGQTVLIPTAFAVAGATNAPDPSIERYGTSTVAATRSGAVHIVKRGESMGSIAARYDITVSRLKTLNGIRGNRVVAGQALRVKGVASKSAHASSISAEHRTARTAEVERSVGKRSAKTDGASKKTASKKPALKKSASVKASAKSSGTNKSPAKKHAVHKAKAKHTASKGE